MDEKRFRFDLFIALCALLISAIAAASSAYQTWVINQQFSATVWPYLVVKGSYESGHVVLTLENDGLGPALVRSAELHLNGKTIAGWTTLMYAFPHRPHTHLYADLSTLDNGDVIRPGEGKTLLNVRGPLPAPSEIMLWEQRHVALDICYCSLLGRCWLMHALADDSTPHDTRSCGRQSIAG